MAGIPDMNWTLGSLQSQVDDALNAWVDNRKTSRLWQKDATLWSGADEAKWLGWLEIAPQMLDQTADLVKFAQGVRDRGITDVLLLGMGGSSLCPEVLAMTFGQREGWPKLHVLDSTVPSQVKRFADGVNLETTLCVVASKSGTTTEPNAFCEFFWPEIESAVGGAAGNHFVAITDPGSALEALAEKRQFLAVFKGVPEIGGRFSALSNFGMVPAALMGIDVYAFLEHAISMGNRCGVNTPDAQNPGLMLGLILSVLAQNGRDKVTFFTSPTLRGLGAWLEQLLAESTGKNNLGLVPVDLELIGDPDVYGQDRVFVYIRLKGEVQTDHERAAGALRDAGFPVIELEVESSLALAAEFFRWEYATAVVGAVWGINPFDQPNVQESKDFTAQLTQMYESSGELPVETPFMVDGQVAFFADATNTAALGAVDDLEACTIRFFGQLVPGDYVALCAFLDMNEDVLASLQRLRHRVRDAFGVATTLGFGPRFLHSTGQLHKGGANRVVVLQFTSDEGPELAIPGRAFSFGVLKDAQALGDASALSSRQRRAIRIHFKADVLKGIDRFGPAIA
jgi:transaldolase/glucose-6-phosphate isomerase